MERFYFKNRKIKDKLNKTDKLTLAVANYLEETFGDFQYPEIKIKRAKELIKIIKKRL